MAEDNKNVTRPSNGLSTDASYIDQPKNTTRFVLNGVDETSEGDRGFIANEEANELCYPLTENYILLGDVYIGDGETLLFSVAPDESSSEIGIADRECNYTIIANADFGFKVTQQISATYRLRRGCEKTIYWVDPKPRYINLNKLEDYKNLAGDWDISKFSLFRSYSSIPIFDNVKIEEGGNLPSGSYNASIQYLDQDLNPTEWISSSEVIKIYKDSITKDYLSIRGSSSLVTAYQDFGITNKSIKFTFSNLDKTYPYYRIAVIEANTGSGQISGVKYSSEIPTDVAVYNYTGSAVSEGTIEEILAFKDTIEEAQHIDQIESKLLLANTKGKQINFCKLQNYASRIKADVVTTTVILNSITDSNPKNGLLDFGNKGYMPGEIYSFGIVYIFEDGTLSPVYHIPGKNSTTENLAFTENSYPMSIDNECQDSFYTDNSCSSQDYWGLDSEGSTLKNKKIRHHRFPTRGSLGKPLLEKSESTTPNLEVYKLSINISGTIDVSYTDTDIEYSVEYTVGGNTFITTKSFSVSTYDPLTGIDLSLYTNSSEIVVTTVYENGVAVTGSNPSGLVYTTSVVLDTITNTGNLYSSEIFGIKFSNVVIPDLIDTTGEKVIGYYIVRNERDEDNKTILDSGILSPLLEEEFFVGHSHLMPSLSDSSRIKTDTFALIHPEHKFFNREYQNADTIIKEGAYLKTGSSVSNVLIQDTMAGTSFDPEVHKRRDSDSDGFDLHIMVRDNGVDYQKKSPEIIAEDAEIDEIFYLDALNSKVIDDINSVKKEIFNVSADNKIGIIKLNKELDVTNLATSLPYVILKRKLSNPYSNFRVSSYYKENMNPQTYLVNTSGDTVFGEEISIFNGDTVITPLRYTSSSYYDIRLKKRKTKSGLFNFILGALAIIAGTVLAFIIPGATVGLVAIGISAVGLGISQVVTGLKKETIGKVWGELYDQGLRDTVQDNDTLSKLEYDNPDDEVQWLSDTLTNIWFESTVNASLRQGTTINVPDFLNAPTTLSTITNSGRIDTSQNEVDSYILDKLTNLDPEQGDGRLYQGFANAELYEINKDYLRYNKEKVFTHLGIEYSCCSDCLETFSGRWHWSEDSFQEELSDNYRVFLPNNYRDIEGETGVITNIYRYYNNVFIHTEEALWKVPQNFQERVTNEIVSFIGTGEYFNIPPTKVVDGHDNSAGTQHKQGCLKTKHGILFPSEKEKKWYLFNGNNLEPISDIENSMWFKENMLITSDEEYYKINKRNFDFSDNPSNPLGTGFISTYDTKKERFIITKKDYTFNSTITNSTDYRLCTSGNSITLFDNYNQRIENRELNGFSFEGFEDCQMKFSKKQTVVVPETRYSTTTIPNEADIVIAYDTSGSFTTAARLEIKAVVDAWLADFQITNPSWIGTLYHYETGANSGENWIQALDNVLNDPTYPYLGTDLSTKDIILICFTNESDPSYQSGTDLTTIAAPQALFTTHYNTFKIRQAELNSFKGIAYPVVFTDTLVTQMFLQHQLAAFKGVPYTLAEVNAIPVNNGFNTTAWANLLTGLQGPNPYDDDGLENYNWVGAFNKYWNGTNEIISEEDFASTLNDLLQGDTSTVETVVNVTKQETFFEYETGTSVSLEDIILYDRSWTMSFSLKKKAWTGWHSYTPSYYFHVAEKFYGWKNSVEGVWRFNKKGQYQTYFGVYYPHIVEYVSVSSPLTTKIYDYLSLITNAQKYDFNSEEYLEERFETFNKILVYNSRQISGVLEMIVKDTQNTPEDYFNQQTVNEVGKIIIDRNEKDWSINDLRDIRVNHSVPMFNKNISSIAAEYYIDKVVNPAAIDFQRSWTDNESFRDKYLVIRLILDKFDSIRLITNYSVENETNSNR